MTVKWELIKKKKDSLVDLGHLETCQKWDFAPRRTFFFSNMGTEEKILILYVSDMLIWTLYLTDIPLFILQSLCYFSSDVRVVERGLWGAVRDVYVKMFSFI